MIQASQYKFNTLGWSVNVGANSQQLREGFPMRFKILALGALTLGSVGCAGLDGAGSSILEPNEYVNPPAALQARPGPMVDGPGPGVMGMIAQPGPMMGPGGPMGVPGQTTQVRFTGQPGMSIGWKVTNGWAEDQLYSGNRFDFMQNAIYQLKFAGFAADGFEELQLYPTLEIRGTAPQTREYLEHSTVPVEVTEQDLEHVLHNNMVTKVIYLPDPKHQARAIAGVETLISTNLDPGIDPVQQAERMGTIMVILRFGNKNLQMPVAAPGVAGGMQQVSHTVYQGSEGQIVPPMPLTILSGGIHGVPGAMIAAGGGMPGQPITPVAGMGPTPKWGMPITATPIGLPGPPHLPFGGPAGLKSHTIRNRSANKIPEPVDHLLVDVKHTPGYNIPEPVRHIQYEENHPTHHPGQLSHPAAGQARF